MTDPQQSLRNIRIVHFGFLAAPLVVSRARHHTDCRQSEPSFIPAVLAALAASEVGIATVFRNKLIRPALEKLQQSPQDSAALAQWLRGNILSFVFALTVVLYGFVVRVLGFSWNIAAWFFVAGFLLLLWTPRMELPPSASAPTPPLP